MDKKPQKNGKDEGAGRPFKMVRWVDELKAVLLENNALFLTDKDLHFLVNQKLPKNDKITLRTFENWVAGKFAPDEETGREFMELLQNARIIQKQALIGKILTDNDKNWYRFAWLAERKFDELNLKHKSESITKNEQTRIIQISAANDEQKALIDNIINADFTEVKPLQIQLKKDVEPTDNKDDIEVPF